MKFTRSFLTFLFLSIILPLSVAKTIITVSAYTLTPPITPPVTPPILPPPVLVYIKVVSPNGGEYLKPGTVVPITWTSSNVPKISIVLDIGSTSPILIANNITNTNKYYWLVPKQINSTQAKIIISGYVSGNLIQDRSDNYFTINNLNICQTCLGKFNCTDYCLQPSALK